jgi:hypothetical protein
MKITHKKIKFSTLLLYKLQKILGNTKKPTFSFLSQVIFQHGEELFQPPQEEEEDDELGYDEHGQPIEYLSGKTEHLLYPKKSKEEASTTLEIHDPSFSGLFYPFGYNTLASPSLTEILEEIKSDNSQNSSSESSSSFWLNFTSIYASCLSQTCTETKNSRSSYKKSSKSSKTLENVDEDRKKCIKLHHTQVKQLMKSFESIRDDFITIDDH